MGPFAPEVYRAPFPNPYRWPGSDPAGEALEALRRMLTTHVAAENVAAIIFEPVQGESGFVVPPVEWVRGVRELASEHGIVLIVDEVQSGFGRTGKFFAIEHFGVEPDLLVVAKSDRRRRAPLRRGGEGRDRRRRARQLDRGDVRGVAARVRRRHRRHRGARGRPARPRRLRSASGSAPGSTT